MTAARIILAPGAAVIEMLCRRIHHEAKAKLEAHHFDAVGLIQTNIPNLYYYADIGQKAGNVLPIEINGNCPQHFSTLAFFGDTAAVSAAMQAVKNIEINNERSKNC
ncbi:BMC domain protein [Pelotomaculum schinkii]|uniref:BMC domain protein n=1 Tax=Pelotomaculum schinkii TaxID=78350 RepID=A0A4Y7R9V5_9FIRM|nr:BMC domain-containing protein [Pelotomaculum schinkii]TEB05430.1 BMC domain protein [Pelotomaculum schinkii]